MIILEGGIPVYTGDFFFISSWSFYFRLKNIELVLGLIRFVSWKKATQVLVQTQIELWSDYPDWNDLWSDFPDRSYPWSDFPDQNDLWSDFPDQNVLWSDRNQTIVQTIVRLWSDPNSDHCPDYTQTMIRLSRPKWPLFRPNPDLCPDYSAPMIRPKFRPLSRL